VVLAICLSNVAFGNGNVHLTCKKERGWVVVRIEGVSVFLFSILP
jgi:hypothetical protein